MKFFSIERPFLTA